MSGDPGGFSMLDLFRAEVETQAHVLTSGLLALERNPAAADRLEACMRAAHSLKGAARIVELGVGVRLAHAMEDCFVGAQQHRIVFRQGDIDALLGAVDLLSRIAATPEPEMAIWAGPKRAEVDACTSALAAILPGGGAGSRAGEHEPGDRLLDDRAASADRPRAESPEPAVDRRAEPRADPSLVERAAADPFEDESAARVLKVTAEHLNRLLALAGESLVAARWVKPFADSLVRLNRLHAEGAKLLERAREAAPAADDRLQRSLEAAHRALAECRRSLTGRIVELETFDRRATALTRRLYDEAVACRMRPFADGVTALPRVVRDLARTLGKEVRLDLLGASTQVDRDVLQQLDAPLGHLVRNAIDHGIEPPAERRAAGKPEEGVITVDARHRAGLLQIAVSDDGRGVDLERLRASVVERKLIAPGAAAALSDHELLEFLFLPGFTLTRAVTDISGRGVGLDAVQDMVRRVRGIVRISTKPGAGTTFQLQLPVTLSVMRTLVAEIAGEAYAFPLASILRAAAVDAGAVETVEGRQHVRVDDRRVGLVAAREVLDLPAGVPPADGGIPVIVLGDAGRAHGLIVDRFIGERELVVQPLDPLLGKVQDVAAGALLEDGTPVLIMDADDLVRTVDTIVAARRVGGTPRGEQAEPAQAAKRVLVVDDSLTVRELERKLLATQGYDVDVAVDGMDGWNALHAGRFDLVVTDVDMPRMDGIELVKQINRDPALRSIPVMIVSYKDREEDRRRGLEAGAARYLTKGSFHDEGLIRAVADLIGEARA